MKTAVIIPPIEDFYFTYHRFACLGALKAAEIIEDFSGLKPEVITFPLMEKKQIPIPAPLNYLKKFILEGETGSCSFFSIFRRYGPAADKCLEIIQEMQPDALFFSLFAYCYAEPAAELADKIRKNMPGVMLAAGGAGVSVNPDYFRPYFDAVLPGEGEIGLKEFFKGFKTIKAEKSGTENNFIENTENQKGFRINNLPETGDRENSDEMESFQKGAFTHAEVSSINTLPCLREAEDIISGKTDYPSSILIHTKEGDFGLSVSTARSDKTSVNVSAVLSRGCTNKCRFCSNFITHGRDFRTVPAAYVKKELEMKEDQFSGHRNKKFFINFEDDNLLLSRDYFFEIIDIFRDFFLRFTDSDKILFSAENGLDYNLLTEEMCGELISKNFRQFNFTLASVSKNLISSEKRGGSTRHLSALLKYIDRKSVPAVTYFIAGLKNDTPEKVIDSLIFIAGNPGISGISMFYSVPGLPDFSDTDYFRNIPPGLLRGSSAYPWNRSLSTEELITAFRISRTVNLFKKKEISPQESDLIKKIREEKKLYTMVKQNKKHTAVRPPGINRKMEELFFSRFLVRHHCPVPR